MKKDPDHNSTDSVEIEALITRIERGQLHDEDAQLLARLLRLLLRLITLLQQKNASLSRLKRLLFGPRSDTRRVTSPSPGAGSEGESGSASSTSTENPSSDISKGARSQSPSRKGGHGRMGAESYTGARLVRCRDAELKPGVGCPHDGCRGKLYNTKQPAIFIRLTGQPLVGATRFEQEVLRCSACQERFTAPLPAGVKPEKYDETCDVSLALAKYGAGLPWYRLARLQESFGVPLPESIQFERCEAVADACPFGERAWRRKISAGSAWLESRLGPERTLWTRIVAIPQIL
ncbi:MAG TPA: hypothetical protein VFV58_03680 [Blastocatellia bacterium]|jgi:hypothetical protein|nr:hypothetical protein [Blastocatellia bacterium]